MKNSIFAKKLISLNIEPLAGGKKGGTVSDLSKMLFRDRMESELQRIRQGVLDLSFPEFLEDRPDVSFCTGETKVIPNAVLTQYLIQLTQSIIDRMSPEIETMISKYGLLPIENTEILSGILESFEDQFPVKVRPIIKKALSN
jgi:hypothetical protein